MTLTQWAERHQISQAALVDLIRLMGMGEPASPISGQPASSEAGVQQHRRLQAAKHGGRLWRNNSGACQDDTGRQIRYGLGNDSPAINKVFKSSDLIGITPVICPCGRRYGVFTAEECKAPGWKLRPSDDRGQAQLNFLNLVLSLGGIARFVSSLED